MCFCFFLYSGAFGQLRAPQPGYGGPYSGQQGYGALPPAQAPPPAAKRLDPDSIPSPVHKQTSSTHMYRVCDTFHILSLLSSCLCCTSIVSLPYRVLFSLLSVFKQAHPQSSVVFGILLLY